jgi:hypothetical protein
LRCYSDRSTRDGAIRETRHAGMITPFGVEHECSAADGNGLILSRGEL